MIFNRSRILFPIFGYLIGLVWRHHVGGRLIRPYIYFKKDTDPDEEMRVCNFCYEPVVSIGNYDESLDYCENCEIVEPDCERITYKQYQKIHCGPSDNESSRGWV